MDDRTATAQRRPKASEWRPKFLEQLALTANISQSCRAAGISRRGCYAARETNKRFATLWAAGVEQAADRLEEEAWRRAVEGIERPVWRGGAQVGTTIERSNQLLIFLLRGLRPSRYDRTVHVEHAGEIPAPRVIILQIGDRPARIIDLETVDVRTLTRDELEALRHLRENSIIEGKAKELPAPA